MKNIILVAFPGAGKGTQAFKLVDNYHLTHISAGDLLRKEVAKDSEIGNQIKDVLATGKMVDNQIIYTLLEKTLKLINNKNGIILDGFPRDLNQAVYLDNLLKNLNSPITNVIYIDVDKKTAYKRIVGRLSCLKCNIVYNKYFDNFEDQGFCNTCHDVLVKRTDDNKETFETRVRHFLKETKVVLEHYKNKGLLNRIDGTKTPDETFGQIKKLLRKK